MSAGSLMLQDLKSMNLTVCATLSGGNYQIENRMMLNISLFRTEKPVFIVRSMILSSRAVRFLNFGFQRVF